MVDVDVADAVKAADVDKATDEIGLVIETVPLDAPAVPVGAAVEAQEATVGTVTWTARQILLANAIVSVDMVSSTAADGARIEG